MPAVHKLLLEEALQDSPQVGQTAVPNVLKSNVHYLKRL